MGLAWEPGNDKQAMYFVFVIKTRHKSVSRGNSKITQKEMPKYFCVTTSPFAEMYLYAREERNQEKDGGLY